MWMMGLGALLALVLWVSLLVWTGWVKPVLRLRDQVLALSKGEWHRVPFQEPLPGELWTVLLRIEGLRRALLHRLRTSTELNLQLESAVARKTADLARRNEELKNALAELGRTKEALLQQERLSAIGEVLRRLTTELREPVHAMEQALGPLDEAFVALQRILSDSNLASSASHTHALFAIQHMQRPLEELLAHADKTHKIVSAARTMVRK